MNSTAVDSYFPVSFRRNKLADLYLNRWTPENPTNEYASYKPNQLLANSIGNYITGMGFFYDGYISEPNSDELGIPVKLDIF